MSAVETGQMTAAETSVLSQQKTSVLSQQQILCVSETCSGPDTSKSPYLDNRRVTFQTDATPKSRIAVRFQWAQSHGELLKKQNLGKNKEHACSGSCTRIIKTDSEEVDWRGRHERLASMLWLQPGSALSSNQDTYSACHNVPRPPRALVQKS